MGKGKSRESFENTRAFFGDPSTWDKVKINIRILIPISQERHINIFIYGNGEAENPDGKINLGKSEVDAIINKIIETDITSIDQASVDKIIQMPDEPRPLITITNPQGQRFSLSFPIGVAIRDDARATSESARIRLFYDVLSPIVEKLK